MRRRRRRRLFWASAIGGLLYAWRLSGREPHGHPMCPTQAYWTGGGREL